MRLALLSLGLFCAGYGAGCAGHETRRAKSPPPPALPASFLAPACGARPHPQRITLREDGTFLLEDLISPCPEGMQCVWSGIATSSGSFVIAGPEIVLSLEVADPRFAGPTPRLRLEDGVPVSESEDGSACRYERE